MKFRADIEGLRAVAVLAVMMFHAFPKYLPGGFAGVDVFFVISGYLISGLIFQAIDAGQFSFRDFYFRRIRRIVPALLLLLLVVVAAAIFLVTREERDRILKEVIASAFFGANFLFWHQAGYFDDSSSLKPLLHLWSLGIEEQFYIVWPLVMVAIGIRKRMRAAFVVALGVISFVVNVALAHYYPTADFYSPFTRFWELMLGAGLALIPARLPALAHQGAGLIGTLGLLASFAFLGSSGFPGIPALLPTISTAALIVGVGAWTNQWLLSNPAATFIGRISYPLYLWHWPLLVFTRLYSYSLYPSPDQRALDLLLAFPLAIGTYLLLERPIRAIPVRRSPRIFATLALLMAIVGAGSAAAMTGHQHYPSKFDQFAWNYYRNPTCDAHYPWRHEVGWWYCETNSSQSPTMIILGDSHANALYPGLVEAFPNERVLNIGTCMPVTGIDFPDAPFDLNPCYGDRTQQQHDFIEEVIAHSPDLKIAVLAALWPGIDADGQRANDGNPSGGTSVAINPAEKSFSQFAVFENGLGRRIGELQRRGIKTVLVLTVPRPAYDVHACIDWPIRKAPRNCIEPVASVQAQRATIVAAAADLQKRFPQLLVFDPLPAFCDQAVCRFMTPDGPLFRDALHLSVLGSEKVGRYFKAWLGDQQLKAYN